MVQVNNNEKLFIRLKFRKTGNLQYISHLDLVRTMHKVIVRAALPLWYTEGFNPKPKMIFAAPLSIGTESKVEFFDLRLTERMPADEVMARLNRNMVDDMQIYDAYYPDTKFTDLKWLSYTITLRLKDADASLSEKMSEYLLCDSVEVEKKGSDELIDIRRLIKSCESSFEDGEIKLLAYLSADPSAFLNPEYIIKALRRKFDILREENLTEESYSIMREQAYFDDMTPFR